MIITTGAKRVAAALGLMLTAGLVAGGLVGGTVRAEESGHTEVKPQKWTFGGILGHFDNAQLQRGFKVYTEVCSRCHSVRRLAFRNLADPGGPAFPEAAVKSLAATYQVDAAPNDEGKVIKRPAILTDYIPGPYKNEQEARYAQNGALPPDLSLIAKARGVEADIPFYLVPVRMIEQIATGYQEAGADYVYNYVTGYANPPPDMKLGDFMNYNKMFPGHQTAMPNPFLGGDGLVKYDDDTPRTIDNYARDVSAFLAWAADPRLDERKRMGLLVMLYLIITVVLLGLAKRRIWASMH